MKKRSEYFRKNVETLPNSLRVMQMENFDIDVLENRHQNMLDTLKDIFNPVH